MSRKMTRCVRKCLALALIFQLIFHMIGQMIVWPGTAAAHRIPGIYAKGAALKTIAPDALPTGGTVMPDEDFEGATATISTIKRGAENRVEVDQLHSKTLIEWDEFNIGTEAEVFFDQHGNANWTAINRILDHDPSQIFGRLSGNGGKVYLINQNGFLFGQGARIGNLHSFTASTLNVAEETIGTTETRFIQENYQDKSDYDVEEVFIENQGDITVETGGAIFLMAPKVANSGSLTAPGGQVGLVAAQGAELYDDTGSASQRAEKMIRVTDNPGTATNTTSGKVMADSGVAGMYGGVVNQEGLVRSVTAVYKNGVVELLASERIHTGADSLTGTPVSTSDDAVVAGSEAGGGHTVTLGGLNTGETDYPESIVHEGRIVAEGGEVTMQAEERIYLAGTSSIDVAGKWADRSASENALTAQLNSPQLSDEFLARLGYVKGETITFNALVGSDVGHIDGYLDQGEFSAAELHTQGGTVQLQTQDKDGDVIVRRGAVIDFSGGGFHYSPGQVKTTKVRIGNAVYDIGDIPDEALERADRMEILSDSEAARYGAAYIPAYDEGDDAGTLSVETGTLVLNGTLKGSATVGLYQTEAAEPTETIGDITYRLNRGRGRPEAGQVYIGDPQTSALDRDRGISKVVIQDRTDALAADFGPEDVLEDTTTYLSAAMLSEAGIGALGVYANLSIETEKDAHLELAPTFIPEDLNEVVLKRPGVVFVARRIDHRGTIRQTGGSVFFHNDSNITSEDSANPTRHVVLEEGIWLREGSRIDVSGEKLFFRNDAVNAPDQRYLDGGTVLLIGDVSGSTLKGGGKYTDALGVFMEAGAAVDISGGCYVAPDGEISGADAGRLAVTGRTIRLDGDIDGHALLGYEGAEFSATALKVGIAADHARLAALDDGQGFYVQDDWFAQRGFTQIELASDYGLQVGAQAELTTSRERFLAPQTRQQERRLVAAEDDYLAPSSVVLEAGKGTFKAVSPGSGDQALMVIGDDALVKVSPGGSISLSGTGVEINGGLVALGGEVSVDATYADIDLTPGAYIDVHGYTQQETQARGDGLPRRYTAYAGGTVNLSAPLGTVRIAPGAYINVSGSTSVRNYYRDNRNRRRSYELAGEAGAVDITAMLIELQGDLRQTFKAGTHLAGLAGGSFSLTSADTANAYHLKSANLADLVSADCNFDALAFHSLAGLVFDDAVDLEVGRSLVLDAPEISAAPGVVVDLGATHIRLENSLDKYELIEVDGAINADPYRTVADAESAGTALHLSSTWMDITGDLALSGFETVALEASKDMTLADEAYNDSNDFLYNWHGLLSTYADLTLTAGRIYPTTDTEFTISTGRVQDGVWNGGTLTIAQAAGGRPDGPILSANGRVILQANQIVHEGTLMAPMGQILLEGLGNGNRIYQGARSVLSTASDAAVPWGWYDGDNWLRTDKSDDPDEAGIAVEGPPERRIDLLAETVDSEPGAVTDLSGGGMVYGLRFEASIAGSADPLTKANRYVIMPDQSVQLPGRAVYLTGLEGLTDGTYSLLPYEYAFLPGAMVIEDLGSVHNTDIHDRTLAGYGQAVGYEAVMGTGLKSAQAHLYVARSSGDVLTEGAYRGEYQVAGDGGDLVINSIRGRLRGTYTGAGLDGFRGARAWISSSAMVLTNKTEEGGEDEDKLYFDPQALVDGGFSSAAFGYIDNLEEFAEMIGPVAEAFAFLENAQQGSYATQTIEVRDLEMGLTGDQAVSVAFYADQRVDFQDNVHIAADELILASPDGEILLSEDTAISADKLGIFAKAMDVDGRFTFGDTVAVAGTGEVTLVDEALAGSGRSADDGLRLHADAWKQLGAVDFVALAGGTGIGTVGRINTGARRLLYLNAPRISGSAYAETTGAGQTLHQEAEFNAANIMFTNTSGAAGTVGEMPQIGFLTFSAHYDADLEEEGFGTGRIMVNDDVTLSGNRTVKLSADRDLILAGSGSLDTDGDLTLSAGRVTAAYRRNADDEYERADFSVAADNGLLTIDTAEGQSAGTDLTSVGGVLRFQADTIEHQGVIDNFAGGVHMRAQSGLYLRSGATIAANGDVIGHTIAGDTVYQAYQAGYVDLESAGELTVEDQAVIDVSHHAVDRPQGVDQQTWADWIDSGKLDAGAIVIDAPQSATQLDGRFLGNALARYTDASGRTVAARGGAFDLSANAVAFSDLAAKLDQGGFNRQVNLRVLTGNLDVAASDTLAAEKIKLVADSGRIDVSGQLQAIGHLPDRRIELYARDDIDLKTGSRLDASGAAGWDADGGQVILGSTQGFIHTREDSLIDVSASGAGAGGSVYLRARRYVSGDDTSADDDPNADDVRLSLAGEIDGAGLVAVEAVRVYDEDDGVYTATGNIQSGHIGTIQGHTDTYMANAAAAAAQLQQSLDLDAGTQFIFMPGVEITRTGNLTLADDWDLAAYDGSAADYDWRYGADDDIPGHLVLRASGDLTIAANLTDKPHDPIQQSGDFTPMDSWSYTLAAGADLSGADPLSTLAGAGDFKINDARLVFTESGDIRIAAGADAVIGKGQTFYYNPSMYTQATSYTLATHDGDILVDTRGSLTITGDTGNNAGAIQTAMGDIRLDVDGDLVMGANSAVRTTGVTTAQVTREMVQDSDILSWLVDYPFINYSHNDPDTGEQVTITISVYDAIYTYHFHEDQVYDQAYGLSGYKDQMDALAITQFHTYTHGGSITARVGGDIQAKIAANAFFHGSRDEDPATAMDPDQSGASYYYDGNAYRPASGIITMAGGDIDLWVGGDIAHQKGNSNSGLQVAAFDQGDLRVKAGGDIEGRFLIQDGLAAITAMGSFGQEAPDRAIEVIDTAGGPAVTVDISAQGDISLGTVIDPIMGSHADWIKNQQNEIEEKSMYWTLHYTENTALTLTAANGNISLSGKASQYKPWNPTLESESLKRLRTALPATVTLNAGRDIVLSLDSNSALWFTPSATGNLTIRAGQDIRGTTVASDGKRTYAQLVVSNLAPEQLYHHLSLPGSISQLSYFDFKGINVLSDFNGFRPAYKDTFDAWWDQNGDWLNQLKDQAPEQYQYYADLRARVNDSGYLLHAGDGQPVLLKAGGDISNIALNSPKKVEVTAQGSITDIFLRIQHTAGDNTASADQTSVVAAGERIAFTALPAYYDAVNDDALPATIQIALRQSGIELSGPGALIVSAGHDLDLGLSAGLRTNGNTYNPALAGEGADLVVSAGYAPSLFRDEDGRWSPAATEIFFDELLQAGIDYSILKYGQLIVEEEVRNADMDWARDLAQTYGLEAEYLALLEGYDSYEEVAQDIRDQAAGLFLAHIRETLINPQLVKTASGNEAGQGDVQAYADAILAAVRGDDDPAEAVGGIEFARAPAYGAISMTQSQIYTRRSGDIYTLNAGDFDVGVSAFADEKSDTGINTMRGGDINIYTAGDLNVNESRIMSWFGGDIVIVSDYGNINAGKGSKTTVSVSDPVKTWDDNIQGYRLEYTLPAVGSGIRLLTYDPDGADGPEKEPKPGDGYFFAWEGEIDAGEAGIVGKGNLLLVAPVLSNTRNIEVAGLSVGASLSQDAGADMGSLSGTTGLSNAALQDEEEGALASAQDRFKEYVAELSDSLVPRWLAVEVTGFVEQDEEPEDCEGLEGAALKNCLEGRLY